MAVPSSKSHRTLNSLRQPRRLHFLRAAAVGLGASLLVVAFQLAIGGVREVFSGLHALATLRPLVGGGAIVIACALGGALAGGLTEVFAPEAGGSGIPHVKAVLHHLRSIRVARLLPIKFFAGALALGSGFALGREGPSVHLGAAAADGVARVLKVPARSRSHLIACGAGAGLAAAFNAPLAGFLFVIEELRRELSPITYGAAFIAAVIADGITRYFSGGRPSLALTLELEPALHALPSVILVGAVAGLGGVCFNRVLLKGLARVSASIPLWKRGAVAGLLIGCATVFVPTSVLDLQGTIDRYLHLAAGVPPSLWVLAGIFVLKFGLTMLSYLSGVPGGVFAPMLAHGALVGALAGLIVESFAPSSALPLGVYGVLGMTAYFSASVRAPLTGVALIAEMTGGFSLLFLLLVAGLVAYLVAELCGEKPLYEGMMELDLRRAGGVKVDDAEALIIDVVVEPGSELDGVPLKSVKLPRGCLIITARHGGHESIPHGDTVLAAGDEMAVLVDGEGREHLPELRHAATAPIE